MVTLPFLVLALTIIYLLLHMSGVLEDLQEQSRRNAARRRGSSRVQESRSSTGSDPMGERLRVFREFINRLPAQTDDEESPRE